MGKGVELDVTDEKGVTPFLREYAKEGKRLGISYELLKQGANINHTSKDGDFALKYAVNKRNFHEIKNLTNEGADVN